MTERLSQSLMSLATCCLGEERREWACAMQSEFQAAMDDGRQLSFAAGCFIAAWRQLPHHAEGRLILSNYFVALGALVPLAALHFLYALGLVTGQESVGSELVRIGSEDLFVASAQLRAIPALAILWVALGIGQLHLAWWLLEGDLSRVLNGGALIAAVMLTLVLFLKVLLLDASPLLLPAAAFGLEVPLVLALVRSRTGVFAGPLTIGLP